MEYVLRRPQLSVGPLVATGALYEAASFFHKMVGLRVQPSYHAQAACCDSSSQVVPQRRRGSRVPLLPRPLASVALAAVTTPLGRLVTSQLLELPGPCIFSPAARLLLALLGTVHLFAATSLGLGALRCRTEHAWLFSRLHFQILGSPHFQILGSPGSNSS